MVIGCLRRNFRDKNLSTVTFPGNFTTLSRREGESKVSILLAASEEFPSNEPDRSGTYLRPRSDT